MEQCFVIQPFSGDFDKRYADTFEPAIMKAGLTPYRIDKDLTSCVPINDIEEKICASTLCFADITIDNPNVWYELGYAFACGKDVVMVCSEERNRFPFDVQHKNIIRYKTGSKSDFEKLEKDIELKLKAYLKKSKIVQNLNETPVKETEGLQSHEIAILILLMENDGSCSMYDLKNEMDKSGYTNIAVSIGAKTLQKSGYLEITTEDDYNGYPYIYCKLIGKGEDWIFANQNLFQFRKPIANASMKKTIHIDLDDDLPF